MATLHFNIEHPLAKAEEDLSWLELEDNVGKINNPLESYDFDKDPVNSLTSVMCNEDYLHFAVQHLLNITLLPFQLIMLDVLWNKKLPLIVATRGGSKTFMYAVYILLRMIFHPGCKVIIVGGGFRQSREVIENMIYIWDNSPVLRDIAGKGRRVGPKREIDRVEFLIGKSKTIAIPLGDGTKIRGLRGNYIIVDEFASIPIDIFNIVVRGFGVVSDSPVEKVKDTLLIHRLKKEGQWSDELEEVRRSSLGGNQIVCSGTAFFEFNHFADYVKKWEMIIRSQGHSKILEELFGNDQTVQEGFSWKDYALLKIPYTAVPAGFLDQTMLAQAKATLHSSQFLMEYGAIFPKDSDGFYKMSVLEACTTNRPIKTPLGQSIQFSVSRQGVTGSDYILSVDPAKDKDRAAIIILEIHPDHRRIVHCWSTDKKKFLKLKKLNITSEDNYYAFIARKIRDYMKAFHIIKIAMDSQGGGGAIAEILGDSKVCEDRESPIYEVIEEDNEKYTDHLKGLHILQMIKPAPEYNAAANHGMLKDFQAKALLFPAFDTIEMAKAIEIDKINDLIIDTYEDLVEEMQELKTEITTIECTLTPTNKEHFDTPRVRKEGYKSRLRKDRYSALLYGNKTARDDAVDYSREETYEPVGASKDTLKTTIHKSNKMYQQIGGRLFKNREWLSKANVAAIKHKRRQ